MVSGIAIINTYFERTVAKTLMVLMGTGVFLSSYSLIQVHVALSLRSQNINQCHQPTLTVRN